MQTLMQDVADAAGVSITTVSHVINGTRPVAAATRTRVLQVVEQLGYVQNASARSLVQGTSRVFGLIISNIENPFITPVIKGFDEACQASNFELVLSMTNYKQPSAEAAVRRMVQDRVRGVAIMSSQFNSELVKQLLSRDIPVVQLDGVQLDRNLGSVRIDYSTGLSQAVKRLAALGHRDVALVHGPRTVLSAERFRKLLVATVEEHGLRIVGSAEGNYQPEDGQAAAQELLSGWAKPTAILCGNDLMAVGVMREALRLGWNVPGDLAIIGSDDVAFAVYSHPSLSTVQSPLRQIGETAFSLLSGMADDPERKGLDAVLITKFIARDSIGPAYGRVGRASMMHQGADASTAKRGKAQNG